MAIFIILTKRSFRFSFLPCICIPFSKCFFCSITTTGRGNLRPPTAIITRKLLLFPSSITLLLLFTFSAICSRSADNSLDSSLQESAFKILTQHQHPHTGSLYRAWLPAEYAGMEVSVVRLRTKTLWRKGTNFSSFSIPPRTVPIPHVKRLVIVYQDMGNWSSEFFSVPGYTLVTHVVGLLCMMHLIEVRLPKICYVESQGRFSIAVPVERRHVLAAYCAVGIGIWFMGMVVVFYVGAVQYRRSRTEKVRVMERDAEEGELFGTVWVGGSKMPSATVTRTQPVLESGNFP
ncbi:hypothetical protein SAY87_031963 [Trapa incisa]|uniref:Uncharacterized protein n=1 Tax=Trapa incisa TaxID=236973 RepID=A0AAN7KQG1_9MYRT|nr:hypothetical protein SAY87_031963 [Trapa incisa]